MLNPLKAKPYVCWKIQNHDEEEKKANSFNNKERTLLCAPKRVTKLYKKIAHLSSMFYNKSSWYPEHLREERGGGRRVGEKSLPFDLNPIRTQK